MIRMGQAGRPAVFDPGWWRDDARCRDMNTNVFYPSTNKQSAAAVAICQECPVIDQCLAYAIDTGQMVGVWGGTNANEREAMRWPTRSG